VSPLLGMFIRLKSETHLQTNSGRSERCLETVSLDAFLTPGVKSRVLGLASERQQYTVTQTCDPTH